MGKSLRKGREAKKALRSAPISEEKNPIKPGLIGGYYRPLSDLNVKKL